LLDVKKEFDEKIQLVERKVLMAITKKNAPQKVEPSKSKSLNFVTILIILISSIVLNRVIERYLF